jgi:hypothetical protein
MVPQERESNAGFSIIEARAMQSKDQYGSHLWVSLSRMNMVDGDNAGERGVMEAMGHGLCVNFCVCGEAMKNKVGPKKSQCLITP